MMKNIAILAIDLGKNVCSLVGSDGLGKVVLRRRIKRGRASLSPCVVAMEPCCGAHPLGQIFVSRGQVRLMSPE
jgi:transposase